MEEKEFMVTYGQDSKRYQRFMIDEGQVALNTPLLAVPA